MQEESKKSLEVSEADLSKVVATIRRNFGFEFEDYAVSSFTRRLVRYMEMNGMEVIDELCVALRSKTIFDEFLKEITVNTTELFRDPGLWSVLREKILPKLFKKNDRVKIWHAACSSGEEVMSMCVTLKELGVLDRADITASDINDDMIKQAQSGLYMAWRMRQYENNYAKVNPEGSLDDHYDMVGSKVQFDMNLIKKVKFKNYDLVLDTSFSQYDLVLIRNVLIYFNMDLQEKVLTNINSSLSPKGYLILGAQESINWHKANDNMMAINNNFKIYKKLRD
jgi:chemotaxis protein methyltransferase CheR